MHAGPSSLLVALLVTGCGADAGVPKVTVTVGTVEVTCRAETGLPDADACGDWGRRLVGRLPEADRLVITRHPRDGACEVDFFRDGHVVLSMSPIPCEA
jgi:hypothetical protein